MKQQQDTQAMVLDANSSITNQRTGTCRKDGWNVADGARIRSMSQRVAEESLENRTNYDIG